MIHIDTTSAKIAPQCDVARRVWKDVASQHRLEQDNKGWIHWSIVQPHHLRWTHDPWWPMDINHRDVVPLLCWFRISKLVRHAINPTVQYIKYIITSIILVICTPTWLLWIRWINHPKQAILALCACEIPTAQGPAVSQPFLMLKNPQLLPGSRSSQPQVLTLTAMPCFFIYRFWVIPKKNIVRDWYCSIFLILI
jgi:hypothetical protein